MAALHPVTQHRAATTGATTMWGMAKVRLLLRALKTGLLGLVLCPALAVGAVILAMIFDPKCGPGDSGGCAMGLATVPLAVALPGFALFFAGSLARGLWQIRPPLPTIRQLRNWGRED